MNNFTTETITKTILRANAANFLQICANLQKYWNNAMSNDHDFFRDIFQVCRYIYIPIRSGVFNEFSNAMKRSPMSEDKVQFSRKN